MADAMVDAEQDAMPDSVIFGYLLDAVEDSAMFGFLLCALVNLLDAAVADAA